MGTITLLKTQRSKSETPVTSSTTIATSTTNVATYSSSDSPYTGAAPNLSFATPSWIGAAAWFNSISPSLMPSMVHARARGAPIAVSAWVFSNLLRKLGLSLNVGFSYHNKRIFRKAQLNQPLVYLQLQHLHECHTFRGERHPLLFGVPELSGAMLWMH